MVVKFKITETEKAFYPAIFTKNVTLILIKISLRKKDDILWRHWQFPCKKTSEKRAQKFHIID